MISRSVFVLRRYGPLRIAGKKLQEKGVRVIAQEQGNTPDKELTQYVRDARKAGLKDAEIQQYAVKSGWSEPAVKEALEYVRATPKSQAAKADSEPATMPVAELSR